MASRSHPDRAHPDPVRPGRRLAAGLVLAAALAALSGPGAGTAHGRAAQATLEVQVTDPAGAPLGSAVVAVLVDGVAPVARPGTTADMAQRARRFAPDVLAVQTGTAVSFPNEDTVRHHVYSFSDTKRFEIKLYVGTPASPVVFDRAGTAVLGCNIHDQMVGFVQVVDTPHFAVTDATGMVRLDVPPGRHRLQVWHPDLDPARPAPTSVVDVASGTNRLKVPLAPAAANRR